jgi:stage IV sporulation protein FB
MPGGEAQPAAYPPKPKVLEKKQNAITRSLISLFIYALLFYLFFEQNLAYVAAILVVLIIHEMGHFLAMRRFGYSNVKIFIVPLLGAFTTGKKQEVSQWQLSVIILAGPVPGIIIGTLLYYFNLEWQSENVKTLAYSFLIINLLNCLPFHPLDGGRLIETLFFRDNYLIHLVFGILSIMGLLLFFLFAQSFVLLIIPFLIGLELYNESKHQKIREYLKQERINYRTDYESLPDKDYWLIRDCLIFSFPKKYAALAPGRYEYSILEGLIIQHITAVLQTSLIADLKGFKRIIVLLFYLFIFIGPVVYLLASRAGQGG